MDEVDEQVIRVEGVDFPVRISKTTDGYMVKNLKLLIHTMGKSIPDALDTQEKATFKHIINNPNLFI